MSLDKTIRIKVDSKGAKRSVDNLDGSVNKLDDSTSKTNKSFGALKATVIAVGAALQVAKVIQYADAFTSIQNQIRQTTTTTEELTKRTSDLLGVANRARTEFGATAELYTKLSLSTTELNLTSDELLRLTETITKSFAIQGKSTVEAAGAIRQLGQAFSKGKLNGDEFVSVSEGADELMRALQKSLGKTKAELADMAGEGKITAEVMVKAFSSAAAVVDDKLDKSVKTLAVSWQEAESNAISFVGASDLVTSSMGAAGESILALSNNLDKIANVVLVAAIFGATRLSAALILNTLETVKNTVAKSNATKTTMVYNAGTLSSTAVITGQTVAMRVATIATNGLKGAMTFLGGPLGVVLLAASALVYFATTSSDSKIETEKMTKAIDDQSDSLKKLNGELAKNKMQELAKAAIDAEFALIPLREELDKLVMQMEAPLAQSSFLGGSQIAMDKIKEKAAALKIQIKELESVINISGAGFSQLETQGATTGSQVTTKKKEEPANNEKFKTASLRAELATRLQLNAAYNDFIMTQVDSFSEQEEARRVYDRDQALIALNQKRADTLIDYSQQLADIENQERTKGVLLTELRGELGLQQLEIGKMFQLEQTQIEQDAADKRVQIAKMEAMEKINSLQNAGQVALNLNELFGSKSEKANKKRRKQGVVINAAAGIARAFAEHNFYAALGISAGIAVMAKQQLSAIDGAGSVSAPSGASSFSSQEPAPRQELPQQQNTVEIRGLSEIAEQLRNMDPGEVLPVEYTQRLVASLDNYNRLSGGGG